MSDETRGSSSSSDPIVEIGWKIAIGLLIVLGGPLILVGLIGSRQIRERLPAHQFLAWSLVVFFALVGLVAGYHFFWPITRPTHPFMILAIDFVRGLQNGAKFDYWRLFREIVPVWAMELVLIPCALVVCAIMEAGRRKSPKELVLQHAQEKQIVARHANKVAERALKKEIPDAITIRKESPYIVLGVPVEGTLLDWIKNRLFCLPFEYLARHAVVLGASGSGKSETLLRIAIAVAKILKWQVIYIDAKGDYKAAAKFLLMMRDAGITNIRMFPLEHYDGWRGTRDSLLSKLLAIDNVAEVTSSGQHHYATVRENLVEMCVNAPGGPPTNSKELLDRLMITNGKLFDLYEGYAEQQAYLEILLKRPQDALSAYGHYRAFFSKAHGKLDGSWSFDDCDAAYVLLDGLAMPEITDGLGRFLLADFVNYATRKDWDKRVLFIFDEVGDLNVPLYSVFEKVRFRNVSVTVSSQDPSGLARKPGGVGTWDEVRRVLGNSAIKIVHRCEDAHEVIKRAGTVETLEENYRVDTTGATIGSGARFREELKINHNDVLRLKAGETLVIGPGEYERVRVAMREVDEERWRNLYKDMERRAKEEAPPMPRRRAGANVVDSTLASTSSSAPSSPSGIPMPKNTARQTGSSGQQDRTGARSASPSGSKKQQTSGTSSQKNGKPSPPKPQAAGQSTSSPGKSGPDVDETLPFVLPEVDPHVPTQPGVLPLWDENGEDLLP